MPKEQVGGPFDRLLILFTWYRTVGTGLKKIRTGSRKAIIGVYSYSYSFSEDCVQSSAEDCCSSMSADVVCFRPCQLNQSILWDLLRKMNGSGMGFAKLVRLGDVWDEGTTMLLVNGTDLRTRKCVDTRVLHYAFGLWSVANVAGTRILRISGELSMKSPWRLAESAKWLLALLFIYCRTESDRIWYFIDRLLKPR